MDEQMIRQDSARVQDDVLKMSAPIQAAWRKAFFDLPITMVCESMRFVAQRLQAQSDFVASLRVCSTMPEMMEAQSSFVRDAVDQYGAETSKMMDDVRSTVSKAA